MYTGNFTYRYILTTIPSSLSPSSNQFILNKIYFDSLYIIYRNEKVTSAVHGQKMLISSLHSLLCQVIVMMPLRPAPVRMPYLAGTSMSMMDSVRHSTTEAAPETRTTLRVMMTAMLSVLEVITALSKY